jgi:hypothetical protein
MSEIADNDDENLKTNESFKGPIGNKQSSLQSKFPFMDDKNGIISIKEELYVEESPPTKKFSGQGIQLETEENDPSPKAVKPNHSSINSWAGDKKKSSVKVAQPQA